MNDTDITNIIHGKKDIMILKMPSVKQFKIFEMLQQNIQQNIFRFHIDLYQQMSSKMQVAILKHH